MKRYDRVLVVCPGGAVTAGPEALHQLVAEMNKLGQAAAIAYHPFDKAFETPQPYRKYGVPVARYAQESGTLIIFPEIFATLALRTAPADAAIWWLSVNNFTGERYGNPLRDRLRYWKYVAKGRAPLGGVKALAHLRHFAQCEYSRQFLAANGIAGEPLYDNIPVYTEPEYLARLPAKLIAARRADRILYNPLKGAPITARLMAAYPEWEWQPLRGLNREQLADAMLGAKLYVDFGHHPGKDRLPREAAIHGCCVIVARHGSAANDVDVPLPERFKLDVKAPDFVQRFGEVAAEVLARFEACAPGFDGYRSAVAHEAATFRGHIQRAFLAHR